MNRAFAVASSAALLLVWLLTSVAKPWSGDVVGPQASANVSSIDGVLKPYYREHGITPEPAVSDELFARRAFLDIIGLLPTPEQIDAFTRDDHSDKHGRLVRSLLDDKGAYADHWLTFWNDSLRNSYRGTGFIDDGREQITEWLYRALYENKPYNQFVHELISPVAGSGGFLKAIKWRGVVNASQRREMQDAQNVAQFFMGTNLKCASCHDSFVNQWSLKDAYRLASVFADEPLEIHRCDKPTGKTALPGFIFSESGEIDSQAPLEVRLKQLADQLTDPKNVRLSRTIVNRLWACLFGRGIVEPLDDMDEEPWSEELLDRLTTDFQEHGYDLKHTIEQICISDAYRLPSVGEMASADEPFVFRGPLVRRMTAEQFVDAVNGLTGEWPAVTPAMRTRDMRKQGGQFLAVVRAVQSVEPVHIDGMWIWSDASSDGGANTVYFRRPIQLSAKPTRVIAVMDASSEFELSVNGAANRKQLVTGKDWHQPVVRDLGKWLNEGANTIAVKVSKRMAEAPSDGAGSPAIDAPGFFFYAVAYQGDERIATIASDSLWRWSDVKTPNWQAVDLNASGWDAAVELGDANAAPWRLGDSMSALFAAHADDPTVFFSKARASLRDTDDLMRALGRPNREQVVTRRDSIATMLQALELTNGGTLYAMLEEGAKHWQKRKWSDTQELVAALYRTALSRQPTAAESATATRLLGSPPTQDSLTDFLWILTMLPEFQLIR